MKEKEVMVKMVLDMWNIRIKQTGELFSKISDEQLLIELEGFKNRGIYLLGHLTAANDQMFGLLDYGKPVVPHYKSIFIDKADKEVWEIPEVSEIRRNWNEVNNGLSDCFQSMSASAWFQKHTSVSQIDFENEPHRNKLNIVLTRSNHLSHHYGQLLILSNFFKNENSNNRHRPHGQGPAENLLSVLSGQYPV
jgi:hypothetical protein